MNYFITSLAAALGSFLAIVITHYLTKRREALGRQFRPRQEAYEEMFTLVRDIVKQGSRIQPDLDAVLRLKVQMLMWGSADTIQAWIALEDGSTAADPVERVLLFEDVLRAIRRDLGHDDSRLRRGELWTLFVAAEEKATIRAHQRRHLK